MFFTSTASFYKHEFRVSLILCWSDKTDDVPYCDNGGDHERHPPAPVDHDYHHGGKVDRGSPLPSPLSRSPRIQVHSLPFAGTLDNEK